MPALGRYELLRPLARGGMADVYLARRRVAGVEKRLVIKRLRRDRHRDPRFLDMFIREAQLSMSLVQQNIVPVFDFGRIGDHVFLAMEYIEGRDLGSSLTRQRGSGMPPLLAAFIAAECCQALDHAHRRREQVIHRDVTARNVLLSWDGEVKLADFGIAAVVGEAAGLFGTPAYMAPEQANGEPVDARTDVYALGIVLWETLVGDHVRPADDRVATLAVARSGELPAIPTSIPAPLAEVIRRATAVTPDARYATAQEMAEALDSFMIVERVREGGQAPAKRLAEWLAERWGEDRAESAAADDAPEGGAIVTFLDDGEQGIRGGLHTQHSMAETAADDEDAEPAPAPPLRARAGTLPPPIAATLPLPAPTRRAGTTPPPLAGKPGTGPTPRPPGTEPLPRPSVKPGTGPTPGGRPRSGTGAPPVAAGKPGTGPTPRPAAKPGTGPTPKPAAQPDAPPEEISPARLLLPSDGHAIDPWAAEAQPEAADGAAADADARPAEGPAAVPAEGADRAPPRGRKRWIAVVLLAIAAALALAYRLGVQRGATLPPDARIALATEGDAATPPDAAEPTPADAAEPTPDAAEPADAAPEPTDAAQPLPLPDAAIIVRVVPRADAGVPPGDGSGSAGSAAALRPIWINALPWAYFTVDSDPKQHETPAMLKLPAGAHRVTFTNPQLGVSRTVTVIVPAQGEARHVEKMN